jgi:indole-3-glycerol phosphate synthase
MTSMQSQLSILNKIVRHKEQEIAQMRERLSLPQIHIQALEAPPTRDFLGALKHSPSKPRLIAEVKKASPSKGIICEDFNPVNIARAYERGGAACISVLCDREFFCGSYENLWLVRQCVSLPLLCKEFIIDPYQIYLARTAGADALLLIAGILSDRDLRFLWQIAYSLGMEALVEVHSLAELDRVLLALPELRLLGINNRNLENFSVDLATTEQLLSQRKKQLNASNVTVVSESGLHQRADLDFVARAGADAILIGESLVKQPNLEEAVRKILSVTSDQLL